MIRRWTDTSNIKILMIIIFPLTMMNFRFILSKLSCITFILGHYYIPVIIVPSKYTYLLNVRFSCLKLSECLLLMSNVLKMSRFAL